MHQQPTAGLEAAELEDIQENRQAHLGQARGFDEVEVRRNGHAASGIHHHLLGVAAARQQRHRPVADLPTGDPLPHFRDGARAFEAQNRRGARGRRVHALALEKIRAVERRGSNGDAHLPGAQFGVGGGAQLKNTLVAWLVDHDGLHRLTLAGRKKPGEPQGPPGSNRFAERKGSKEKAYLRSARV